MNMLLLHNTYYITTRQVLSEPEAQLLLKDNPDLVLAVYDYWLSKRLRAVSILSSLCCYTSQFTDWENLQVVTKINMQLYFV